MEIWKTIEGYSDYEISNKGNVISLKYNRKKLLKLGTGRNGYLIAPLCFCNKRIKIYVHQLVLKHFGPSQPPNTTCDHINRIPTDNRIENLRWANIGQQIENRDAAKGERISSSKLTETQVKEIKIKLLNRITQKNISKEYGVSQVSISHIKLNKHWKHI